MIIFPLRNFPISDLFRKKCISDSSMILFKNSKNKQNFQTNIKIPQKNKWITVCHFFRRISGTPGTEGSTPAALDTVDSSAKGTKLQRFRQFWRTKFTRKQKPPRERPAGVSTKTGTWSRVSKRCAHCWPKMRCPAFKREPKGQMWPGKKARGVSSQQLTGDSQDKPPTKWAKLKNSCRYVEFYRIPF